VEVSEDIVECEKTSEKRIEREGESLERKQRKFALNVVALTTSTKKSHFRWKCTMRLMPLEKKTRIGKICCTQHALVAVNI
jgi:hypothetical protein